MSAAASTEAAGTTGRRCRPRGVVAGALRPTDVLAAFFLLGVAYMAAGALVAVAHDATGWSSGRWLAVHLALVGGVSQLMLGASQFFVGAFLATDPPARGLVRAQLGGTSHDRKPIARPSRPNDLGRSPHKAR